MVTSPDATHSDIPISHRVLNIYGKYRKEILSYCGRHVKERYDGLVMYFRGET
jgi:hypothetical protein